ncbi:MAG: hypothetical protein ACRDOI_32285 [Trebonia sp.]
MQRLFVCFVQLVDEHATEASACAALEVVYGGVVIAGAGQGEQHLAGEVGGQEYRGMVWYEPGEGRREEDDP